MAKYEYVTTNKYGKTVFMPRTEGTKPEQAIANALDSIGIHEDGDNSDGLRYTMGFFFDETGYRRNSSSNTTGKHTTMNPFSKALASALKDARHTLSGPGSGKLSKPR